jgi:REP element-mobilizing transposase RayT
MSTQADQPESNMNSDLKNPAMDDLSSTNSNEEILLEPLEKNPYDVSYTCLLLPKSISRQLTDDVADFLQSNLEKISVEYGWSLEFLSIKPDHVQWAIRVPPSTATTQVIYVIRQQTSQRLFEKYPTFKMEDQSEDFWAPGYLIFSGSHPHPIEVIQRYIQQTRKQQGIQVDE